jgi:transposase
MKSIPAADPTFSSSDLNPIERAFAKLKAHLRKAAGRSIPDLQDRIGSIAEELGLDGKLRLPLERIA